MKTALVALAVSLLAAQPVPQLRDLAPGVFLVASADLTDPNFAESVVFLIDYGRTGAMGLIVNRRSDVPLSKALPSLRSSSVLYEGGPVSPRGALALVRSKEVPPEEPRQVIPGVFLVSAPEALEKSVADLPPQAVRVYLGYSGWAPGQLEREVSLGAWRIVPGSAAQVFDPEPATLWKRLLRGATSRMARR